ncbi:MAG: 16S rRNA (guanine(527)-N(7))-methyltransferase RsmG [Gammaproteobacteria bacterium CG11_big_fil_rev_8_21_14_0_20_46_22]|nr:MAG: 16S rRNA (guanine(527)-N(7))-methyltransferase RsmG [Gammaproteobacteria bacterium CG12_big_fil_rev_8_21_14_0_65_46_12]PIR10996.1 MAG: 16S rRNA (guanine(527)-N(7))-methyltransferase RsmG [Gammaproteobacteria bacterium CG11_big_fil_rev_8_21_14_0_20_46_22]
MNNSEQKLQAYLVLLKKWNKVFNLTAIESDEAMMDLHLQDSLNIQPFLQGDRILDVGSGAGLPGIPLAIACPDKQFYLLDTNGKRTRFLTQVKIELGLNNVHVIKSRVETYSPDGLFTSITSRAFSSLSDFFDKTHHLLEKEGVLLAMKGQYPEEELKAIHTPYEVKTLPALKQHDARHLVVIKR